MFAQVLAKFNFKVFFVCGEQTMEGKHGPVAVTLAYGALTCAGEALATLLLSTLLKSQLFTPVIIYFFQLYFSFFLFFDSQFCLDSGFQTVKFVKLYLSFFPLKICLFFLMVHAIMRRSLFFLIIKKKSLICVVICSGVFTCTVL